MHAARMRAAHLDLFVPDVVRRHGDRLLHRQQRQHLHAGFSQPSLQGFWLRPSWVNPSTSPQESVQQVWPGHGQVRSSMLTWCSPPCPSRLPKRKERHMQTKVCAQCLGLGRRCSGTGAAAGAAAPAPHLAQVVLHDKQVQQPRRPTWHRWFCMTSRRGSPGAPPGTGGSA